MKMEIIDVICICTIYLSFIYFCSEDISFNKHFTRAVSVSTVYGGGFTQLIIRRYLRMHSLPS